MIPMRLLKKVKEWKANVMKMQLSAINLKLCNAIKAKDKYI